MDSALVQQQLSESGARSRHDAALVAVHCALLSQGFVVVSSSANTPAARASGDGDGADASSNVASSTASSASLSISGALPPNWNASTSSNATDDANADIYVVRYCFGALTNAVFELKALVVASRLLVHIVAPADSSTVSDEIDVSGLDISTASTLMPVIKRTVDNVARSLRCKHTPATDPPAPSSSNAASTAASRSPSASSNLSDPLRMPTRGGYYPYDPLSVGEGDRRPVYSPTYGLLKQFEFHIFVALMPPPGVRPAPGFLPPGAVPPGARFDPIVGPVGPGNGWPGGVRPSGYRPAQRGPRSDPDPDHLPPPGYGDMFM
ncbi:hypothetical protein CAOG_06305 [Capsaspora owczarzaki ATCC 30864]|uniref:hypothetical protein n=1 Tax=Capsaspora owczarzaki (strain ATCC 30864) TaxID=595528 RepID=UPI0003525B67|nr:hypothetical protein CAOG_06305 [Capsaspora owczarzaki ATCC 30864]|eukprot:XP_004345054.2 hypothetical protein CAOG_06305 [Capsaspora owczarzaki ATCC 30864]